MFGTFHSDSLDSPVAALCLLTLRENGEEASVLILNERCQVISRVLVEPPITHTREKRSFHSGIIKLQDKTRQRLPTLQGNFAEFCDWRIEFSTEADATLLCVISESLAEYTCDYELQADPYPIILAFSILIAVKCQYKNIIEILATNSKPVHSRTGPMAKRLTEETMDLAAKFMRNELPPIPSGGEQFMTPPRTHQRSLFMWVVRSGYKGIARTLMELKGENSGVKLLQEVSGTVDEQINELMADVFEEGSTPLQYAAYLGHLPSVVELVEAGANVNFYPAWSRGRTALQAAAEEGHLDLVRYLLGKGANVNAAAVKTGGRTALQAATEAGHLSIVKELLQAGADVNAPIAIDTNGISALVGGAMSGQIPIVQCLLDAGANVQDELGDDTIYDSALQAASALGHDAVAGLLLNVGADIESIASGFEGRTPLQAAAEAGRESVVNRLIAARANVNAFAARMRGVTALQAAAAGGHTSIVQALLTAGADLELRSAQELPFTNPQKTSKHTTSHTALEAASLMGHAGIVKILLQVGAKVTGSITTLSNYCDLTPLQAAAGEGHAAVVDELIKAGALACTCAIEDYESGIILLTAVQNGHVNVVRQLLTAGVNVDGADTSEYQASPLEAAARRGHKAIVDMLLEGGANVNTAKRTSALSSAALRGHPDIVDCLIRAGADVNFRNKGGDTVLQEAASQGCLSVVKSLLNAGSNVNAEAKSQGHTALYVAVDAEHVEVVAELLTAGANVNAPAHDFNKTHNGKYTSFVMRDRKTEATELAEGRRARGIDWGASRNSWGDTALSAAVTRRNLPILRLLLQAGADPNLVHDPSGKSAYEVAIMSCAGPEILQLIECSAMSKE